MSAIEKMAKLRDKANVDRTLWLRQLKQNASGGIKGDLDNVMLAIELAPDLVGIVAYDEFARRLMKVKATPWDKTTNLRAWADNDGVHLQRYLQQQGVPAASIAAVEAAVLAVARKFDPLREFLDGTKWDGTKRVGKWLPRYLGAEASSYTLAIGPKFLVSAVARGLEPGVQADHTLSLEGEQGRGKSSTVAILAGPFNKENLPDLHSKDAAIELQGSWIVELPEMAAMTRSETESIKAFLTRRVDKIREPYGRHAVEMPRRCVFIVTTNESRYLKDTTGNRRFWPVKVGTIDLDALARDRDQLWAEAVRMYRNGAKWHLTDAATIRAAESEQLARVEDDPWTPLLEDFIKVRAPVTTRQLLTKVGVENERLAGGHAKRVGGIMRRWGFTSHVDKSHERRDVWWMPHEWTAEQFKKWFIDYEARQAKQLKNGANDERRTTASNTKKGGRTRGK